VVPLQLRLWRASCGSRVCAATLRLIIPALSESSPNPSREQEPANAIPCACMQYIYMYYYEICNMRMGANQCFFTTSLFAASRTPWLVHGLSLWDCRG
jgi:hypothetical protein